MKERKRFLLYYDWENLIQDMSDTDIASLTRGIFKYQNTGEISDMTYGAKLAFAFMRPVFDEDRKDWIETSKKNSDNAKKRWDNMRPHTTAYEGMPPNTSECQVMPLSTDSDIDSVSGIDIDIIKTNNTIVLGSTDLVNKSDSGINNIIQFIKETVEAQGFIYKAGKQERNRAKNILTGKDFGATCEKANMSRIDFCYNIILTSTKLDFWNGKIHNAESLYTHYAKVYNDAVNLKTKIQKDTSLITF